MRPSLTQMHKVQYSLRSVSVKSCVVSRGCVVVKFTGWRLWMSVSLEWPEVATKCHFRLKLPTWLNSNYPVLQSESLKQRPSYLWHARKSVFVHRTSVSPLASECSSGSCLCLNLQVGCPILPFWLVTLIVFITVTNETRWVWQPLLLPANSGLICPHSSD